MRNNNISRILYLDPKIIENHIFPLQGVQAPEFKIPSDDSLTLERAKVTPVTHPLTLTLTVTLTLTHTHTLTS